ncbi:MAG: glycosyltransferase [Parvularcula sp.]
MRILSLTTLYPSEARPTHGVFVENRLRALTELGHEVRVIAPVPRFPFTAKIFGDYSRFARTEELETRFGIDIDHPRYTVLPKIGMSLAAHSLTLCFKNAIAQVLDEGFSPDLLDAHYYYPDGVAAAAAARQFDLPLVITARGTDINLIPEYPRQRQMILEAADQAQATITVADALRREMIDLGAEAAKIHPIRNGVDLSTFRPVTPLPTEAPQAPQAPLRLASVGHLIERKGHHLVIEALTDLPGAQLEIAGTGPEEARLRTLAKRTGVADRVNFLGAIPHDRLKEVYGRADVTVLASSREGWPNVLLESMACGTPCVATNVWGSGEVIAAPEAGLLAEQRTAKCLATTISTLSSSLPARTETRAYAERFGWSEVAEQVGHVWTQAANSGWGRRTKLPEGTGSRFLFTVDTEEMFDWNGGQAQWTLPPLEPLERLQEMAEAAGVIPLYFTTYPLLNDPEIGGRLRQWVADGRAHCGLHLHMWATPPGGEADGPAGTFQCNAPQDLHRKKLNTLIKAFQDRLGIAPIAHRAGRYGAAPWVLDQLAEAGVLLDFSPSAGFDARAEQGPDFRHIGNAPRVRETAHGPQWVFPVSGARKLRKTGHFLAPHGAIARALPEDLLSSVTVGTRLTPEGIPLQRMQALTRFLVGTDDLLLTPSIHQTSVHPGATPYARTSEEADALLRRLEKWFEFARAIGIRQMPLNELATLTDLPIAARPRRLAS